MIRKIAGIDCNVLDVINGLTFPDSLVCRQNKINEGHGEAKLYVGNMSVGLSDFFEGFEKPLKCFLLKDDILSYMKALKDEYMNPTQDYAAKTEFPYRYQSLMDQISQKTEVLHFEMERSSVELPRVYINAIGNNEQKRKSNWQILRNIALPNLSVLSVMKIKVEKNIFYYFKLEADLVLQDEKNEIVCREIEEQLKRDDSITTTERKSLILARRGQGIFREELLRECRLCPFTMVDDAHLLIASHIKPWKASNNFERLDKTNGFIFTPTYDRLFDQGYITFTDTKELIISPWLSRINQRRLNLIDGMTIDLLPTMEWTRKQYLLYHRNNVFKV